MLHSSYLFSPLSHSQLSAFLQVFTLRRTRLTGLKSSLGLPCPSYKHLSWRLDVELARRNDLSRMQPEYLLSLEVEDRSLGSVFSTSMSQGSAAQPTSSRTRSYRLKASYTAMTAVLSALQAAVDEMKGVHCQRLQRYLS